jgi:hypothetical protein
MGVYVMRKTINFALMVALFILILCLILAINADVKTNNSEPKTTNTDNNEKKVTEIPNINLSPSDVPKLVEVIKVWKLMDDVELEKLGDEKMIIFLIKYKQLEKIRFNYHREKGDAAQNLKKLLESSQSDDQIKTALENIKKIDSNFREKEKQFLDVLNSYLTPKQQAEFIVFQDNYWRDMRQMVRNLKELSSLRENSIKSQPEVLSQK